MNPKHILITGGAGYIGSVTAAMLLEKNHKVTILDNLEMGHIETIDLLKQKFGELEFIKADLRNKEELQEKLKNKNIDAVIHFAAYIEVGRSVEQPDLFIENNFGGSKNLMEVMEEEKINNLIFSSTAAVYGHPEDVPIKESAKINPINPYGQSKVMTENEIIERVNKGKLNAVILRYFNPAGSYKGIGEMHEPETHLIPNIFKSAQGEGKVLKIFGDDYDTPDGTCIRDYIHVEDLAFVHIQTISHLFSNPGIHIYNVGTGQGISVKEIFNLCEKIIGLKIPYEIVDRRAGDSKSLIADPQKIETELGWKAKYDIKDIIKSAWEFEKNK